MLIVNDRPNMLHAGRLFQLHCVNQLFKAHCPDFYLKKKKNEEEEAVFPLNGLSESYWESWIRSCYYWSLKYITIPSENAFERTLSRRSGAPAAGYQGVFSQVLSPERCSEQAFALQHLSASLCVQSRPTAALLLNPVLPQKLACRWYLATLLCLPLTRRSFWPRTSFPSDV